MIGRMCSNCLRLAGFSRLAGGAGAGKPNDDPEEGRIQPTPKGTQIQQASALCKVQSPGVYDREFIVADHGHTVTVETNNDNDIKGYLLYQCLTHELKTPASITSRVAQATAAMGQQTGEAGGHQYAWSYHPDNGLYFQAADGGE
jgi:hypothetical protein